MRNNGEKFKGLDMTRNKKVENLKKVRNE